MMRSNLGTQNQMIRELRFACLERVSTEAQANRGESLKIQKLANEKAVESLDGIVIKHYHDFESATPGKEHLLLNQILHDAEQKKFDAIVMQTLDRFSRDIGEFVKVCTNLKNLGIFLFEHTNEIDLNNNTTIMTAYIRTIMAQWDATSYAERSYDAKYARAKKGYPSMGRIPFGYDFVIDASGELKYKIIPECREFLLKAYDLYVEKGHTFRQVAKILRKDELWPVVKEKSNSGIRNLDPETLRKILVNRAADSTWIINPKRKGYDEEIRIDLGEALLPLDMVQKIKQVAKSRKVNNHPKIHSYPLSGFIFCKNCGYSLRGLSSGEYRYYRHDRGIDCCSHVRADEVEGVVFHELSVFLNNQNNLASALSNAVYSDITKRSELEDEYKSTEKNKKSLDKMIEKYVESIGLENEERTRKQLVKKINDLNSELGKLEEKSCELQQQICSLTKHISDRGIDKVHKLLMKYFGRVNILTMSESRKKELLAFLIREETVQQRKKIGRGIYISDSYDNVIEKTVTKLEILGDFCLIEAPVSIKGEKKYTVYESIDDRYYSHMDEDIDVVGLSQLVASWEMGRSYSRNLVDQYQYS